MCVMLVGMVVSVRNVSMSYSHSFPHLLTSLACSRNRYGLDCKSICNCVHERSFCHHVTGQCICFPGYGGPQCAIGISHTFSSNFKNIFRV